MESNELDLSSMHPLISWRSVVAGLLISLFSLMGFIGLGLAFGGIGFDEDTSVRSAGIFTGVWFVISSLLSLFIGSYFAARVSKFQTGRVGSAQGLVIAALFLGFFLYQTFMMIGFAGSALSGLVSGGANMISTGAQNAASSPRVTNTISNMTEDALGDLNLRSDPQTVISGVSSRLLRGETESAKNYLALEAGISPSEADARINQLQGQVTRLVDDAKESTATALRSVGWTLFLLVALGSMSAVAGGALGSVANFRKPLSREPKFRHQHA